MSEHPSLTLNQPKPKTAKETLSNLTTEADKIKSQASSLKEASNLLAESSSLLANEFDSIDALQALAGIEAKIDMFTAKYTAVLDKIEANVDIEKEALTNLLKLTNTV